MSFKWFTSRKQQKWYHFHFQPNVSEKNASTSKKKSAQSHQTESDEANEKNRTTQLIKILEKWQRTFTFGLICFLALWMMMMVVVLRFWTSQICSAAHYMIRSFMRFYDNISSLVYHHNFHFPETVWTMKRNGLDAPNQQHVHIINRMIARIKKNGTKKQLGKMTIKAKRV